MSGTRRLATILAVVAAISLLPLVLLRSGEPSEPLPATLRPRPRPARPTSGTTVAPRPTPRPTPTASHLPPPARRVRSPPPPGAPPSPPYGAVLSEAAASAAQETACAKSTAAARPVASWPTDADTMPMARIRLSWPMFEPKKSPAWLRPSEDARVDAAAFAPGAGWRLDVLLDALDSSDPEVITRPLRAYPVNGARFAFPHAAAFLPTVDSPAAAMASRELLDFVRVLFSGAPVASPARDALKFSFNSMWPVLNVDQVPDPTVPPLLLLLDERPGRAAELKYLLSALADVDDIETSTLVIVVDGDADLADIADVLLEYAIFSRTYVFLFPRLLTAQAWQLESGLEEPVTALALTGLRIVHDVLGAETAIGLSLSLRPLPSFLRHTARLAPLVADGTLFAADALARGQLHDCSLLADRILARGECLANDPSAVTVETSAVLAWTLAAQPADSLAGLVWAERHYRLLASAALASTDALALGPGAVLAAAADALGSGIAVAVPCAAHGTWAEPSAAWEAKLPTAHVAAPELMPVGDMPAAIKAALKNVRGAETSAAPWPRTCTRDARPPTAAPLRDYPPQPSKEPASSAKTGYDLVDAGSDDAVHPEYWRAAPPFVTDGVASAKQSAQCGGCRGEAGRLAGIQAEVGDNPAKTMSSAVVAISWPTLEPAAPPEMLEPPADDDEAFVPGVGWDLAHLVRGLSSSMSKPGDEYTPRWMVAVPDGPPGGVDVVKALLAPEDGPPKESLGVDMLKAAWNAQWPVLNAAAVPARDHAPIGMRLFARLDALPTCLDTLAAVDGLDETEVIISIDGTENLLAFIELVASKVTQTRVYFLLHGYLPDAVLLGAEYATQYADGPPTGGGKYARANVNFLYLFRVMFDTLGYNYAAFTADDMVFAPSYYKYVHGLGPLTAADPNLVAIFSYPHGLAHDCNYIVSAMTNSGECKISDTETVFVEPEYFVDWGNGMTAPIFYDVFPAIITSLLPEPYDGTIYVMVGKDRFAIGPCSHRTQYITGITGISGASGARWDTGMPLLASIANYSTFGDTFEIIGEHASKVAHLGDVVLGVWPNDGSRAAPSFDPCLPPSP
ncbi:uncharacterized protein AMSG_03072 [Thecamonas trahens ATCC 50062]|uniref:Uncharacterized protein n=1 Tax=Thecamonas trahens ATCC 50062 TaxID=461836 RepID=A0A0L0D389_THETB|nr:hypothetical protein AMSG_03072 [Thecamonas trahens ATCC 50062]KNC46635.1 hypothetical protein AMSG_03072 [Thecamonas trahens ATCC 50062]|eukprot:XP_013760408.1 hypothetical protein AMSG_03072 [Thecamonas trahens ATCC 50062]